MTITLTLSLSLFLIAWFITTNEWIQESIDELFDWLVAKSLGSNVAIWILDKLYTIVGCTKCLTFWLILIGTINPLIALSFAWVASIQQDIKKIANK